MAVSSNWTFSVYSDLKLNSAFYMAFGIILSYWLKLRNSWEIHEELRNSCIITAFNNPRWCNFIKILKQLLQMTLQFCIFFMKHKNILMKLLARKNFFFYPCVICCPINKDWFWVTILNLNKCQSLANYRTWNWNFSSTVVHFLSKIYVILLIKLILFVQWNLYRF